MKKSWKEFQKERLELLSNSKMQDLYRFDLTDPCSAFEFTPFSRPRSEEEIAAETAVSAWADYASINSESIVKGSGVRELLRRILTGLAKQTKSADSIRKLWLPSDAYPPYWALTTQFGLQGFITSPELDLQFLSASGPEDVLVLPIPLVTTGRWPNTQALNLLAKWLAEEAKRWLIVDAVYAYRMDFSRLAEHIQSNRCVIVHSLSKSWLQPRELGVAFGPEGLSSIIGGQGPQTVSLAVLESLSAKQALPKMQEELFLTAWESMKEILPELAVPSEGYYTLACCTWEELLYERHVLSLPATIFGSERTDLSVLSCLSSAAALL